MAGQGQSRRAGQVAHGKQSAIGTPLAVPTWVTSKAGGGFKVARDKADLPFTRATAIRPGQYVQRARGQGTLTVGMFPDPMGLWLAQVMGGQSVSGAGPFKHVDQMVDTLPTPQTIYDFVIDDWWRFADAYTTKVVMRATTGEVGLMDIDMTSFQADRVTSPIAAAVGTIAASPTGATEAANVVTITTSAPHGLAIGQWVTITGVAVAGYNGTFQVVTVPSGTTFTYTNPTAGLAGSGAGSVLIGQTPDSPRFKYTGAVVQAEADSATPQTLPNAENVEITIDRGPNYRYGSSVTPTLIYPERMVSFSIGVEYDTQTGSQGWDFVMAAATGAVGATGPVTDIQPVGSAFVNFGRAPADATRYCKVYSGPSTTNDAAPYAANWQYEAERPDSDQGGGPGDYDIAGPLADVTGSMTSEITVAIANDTSGNY